MRLPRFAVKLVRCLFMIASKIIEKQIDEKSQENWLSITSKR